MKDFLPKMPLPKVLYLVPNGQNPVSYVAPLERKQALYRVCQKYDLMIVEDDPYFYLQFPFDGMYDSTPLPQPRNPQISAGDYLLVTLL